MRTTPDLTVVPDQTRRLHRLNDVAAQLAVDRRTVYRLVESGHLTLVKVGGASRITADSLDAYLDKIHGGAA